MIHRILNKKEALYVDSTFMFCHLHNYTQVFFRHKYYISTILHYYLLSIQCNTIQCKIQFYLNYYIYEMDYHN